MAVSYNKVILAGNLTRDPELKPIGNDKSVTRFGLAINRRYKKGDETCEEVTFIDCEAWNKTGELLCQHCAKGSSVLVEGRMALDQWEDKDGQKRSKLKVVADGIQFLTFKDKGGQSGPAPAPTRTAHAPTYGDEPNW